ncbi:MAG: hypothetical protein AAGA56_09175 [Myxococcota bacterium]
MRWSMIVGLGLLVSCGGDDDVAVPADYPSGPYGTEVGEVFTYFEAEAFRVDEGQTDLANTGSLEPLTMLDVKNAGPSHVLLHLAAMW